MTMSNQQPQSDKKIYLQVAEVYDHETGQKYYYPLKGSGLKLGDGDGSGSEKAVEDYKKIKEISEQLFNSQLANDSGDFGDGKGNMSSSLKSYLKDIYKIKLPWDDLLENAILYSVQNVEQRSWSMFDPYVRHIRLPGVIKDGLATHTLVVCVDSSGSISDEDMLKFFSVILDASENFEKIIILVHDVEIQDEFEIDMDQKDKEVIKNHVKSFSGRGGTSHQYVFKRINEIQEDHNISSVVFLTDFYSDVEYLLGTEDGAWMKDFDTIWILNHPEVSMVKFDEEVYNYKVLSIVDVKI